ncbi:MAG: polysaccharide biosynthesis/export family protein [Bradyrhizobium sp.]
MPTIRLPCGTGGSFFRKAFRPGTALGVKLALLAAVLLCSAAQARADYRLQVGDVIEIAVARIPELKQRVPVQLDGSIAFPMLGNLLVAGLTPSEAQARIQVVLATKVFRQRMSDGRETDTSIDHDEVTATVVQFRPIYVNGDIAKPGEYSYRPLLTVRQAVALSGGYELMRYRTTNPILESADLRAEYETLWTQFAKEQAHVWRLKAELGAAKNIDQSTLRDLPVARSTVTELLGPEAAQLKARQTDLEREKTFLQHAITQGAEQIQVLSEQQKEDDQGAKADVEELQRTIDLYGKGSLPSPRVADSRRAVLLSSTRRLQTMAQLMQIKQQQDGFSRQVEKLDDQRRIDLLRELQDANMKLSEIRAKLQSTTEKLQYTSIAKSQLIRGGANQPEIILVRSGDKGQERIAVNEETELEPGDVVEVALRLGPPTGQNDGQE